jgi:thiol-disulfide isomerase/thioredoxin
MNQRLAVKGSILLFLELFPLLSLFFTIMFKILTLLATLSFLASCTQTPDSPAVTVDDKKIMTGSDMMKDDMMKTDTMNGEKNMMDDDMMDKESVIMKPTGYISYDEGKVSEALASGQKVALFFHAAWCPSCKALDKAINSSLSSIPADTLIVKVDFDSSTELKKKYRVVGQHTTVILGADGSEKSKKLGARSVAEIFE